jgi:hypothetical protein
MWDALVGFFKGGSPFKLMIDAGKNFSESMALGVASGASSPVGEAVSLANDMRRAVTNNFYLTAQYGQRGESELVQDINLLQMMYGQ